MLYSTKMVLAVGIMAACLLPMTAFLSVAAAQSEGEILVRKLEDGTASVRYELSEEVSELRFYVDSPRIRTDYWRMETASLQVQGDRIVSPSGSMFAQAALTLIANDQPYDRVYPSLISFDDATSLVNIDYIRATNGFNDLPITLQNAYDPYEQDCVANYRIESEQRKTLPDTGGRYVFLATRLEDCTSAFKPEAPGVVVSGKASGALEELISHAFLPIYKQLEQRFGIPVRPAPTVFLSHQRGSTHNSFQADVGWDSVISLRFFGNAWDELDEASSVQVLNTLAHEVVHLWIGTTFSVPGQPARAWLHEGAAEYIALRELLQKDWISQEYFQTKIERHLAGCNRALGAMSLMTERAPRGGRLVYDCGVLIQFVYDIVTHSQTNGQQTVVDLWRHLMSASLEAGTFAVTAEEFVKSSEPSQEILASILYGPQMDTAALLEALREFGVDSMLEEDTTVNALMSTLLSVFFRADCETGPWGFFTLDDHLALDSNDTCRSIPAGFVLRRIQDLDVFENTSRAFESVSEECARGGIIQMSGRTPDEPEITLQCPGQIPDHPTRIVVRKLPRF